MEKAWSGVAPSTQAASSISRGIEAKKVVLPSDMSVDIEVDLGMTGNAYFIQARIDIRMPGVARDVAEAIAHAAHAMCPYSKAVHGNIDVATNVLVADAVAA